MICTGNLMNVTSITGTVLHSNSEMCFSFLTREMSEYVKDKMKVRLETVTKH